MIKNLSIIILLSLSIFASQNNQIFQQVNKEYATLVKNNSSKEFCNVCGMDLIRFYKTSYAVEFQNTHKEQYCSLHCFAKINKHFMHMIKKVEVVDTKSLKLIDTNKAYYVVGSSIKGTMSIISKYAFLQKKEALEFISKNGGELKTFKESLNIATKDLLKDEIIIDKKREKIAKKGKKIFEVMCNNNKLPIFNSVGEAKQYLIDNNICKNLEADMAQAVAIYTFNPAYATSNNKKIQIPTDAKCHVCGMFVAKFPKWVAKMSIDEHTHYFDGTKDMFIFYFNPSKYSHNHKKEQIQEIKVTDYYTLEEIDAKQAYYVLGSNVYGPMGEELIPFKNEKSAKNFKESHYGKKIFKFEEVKENLF